MAREGCSGREQNRGQTRVFHGLTSLAVVALRRAQPVTLAVFRAVLWGFVANTFLATPGPAIVGTLLIAAGVPVYFIWRRKG